jgi:drug/metabolite transporter (DMT)-like permease
MKKNKQLHLWFLAGLVAALLSAPNGIFIKLAGDSLDPLVFNSLRFILITIVTLPYVVYMRNKYTKTNIKYALLMGVCMTIAALSYVGAIQLSQASYVAIIALGMPIVFILYSIAMTGERVRSRSVVGVSLAVVGAFVVVAWPLIAGGSVGNYNGWATVLAVVDVLVFPLAIIFSRKANEHGMPVMASFGISSIVVATTSTVLAFIFVGAAGYAAAWNPQTVLAVIYSAIAVALIARLLNVMSYERLGSVVTAGLSYIENLLAILLPLIILGETITSELITGGFLILVGVYIAETQHHSKKHRHIRVMQHR